MTNPGCALPGVSMRHASKVSTTTCLSSFCPFSESKKGPLFWSAKDAGVHPTNQGRYGLVQRKDRGANAGTAGRPWNRHTAFALFVEKPCKKFATII